MQMGVASLRRELATINATVGTSCLHFFDLLTFESTTSKLVFACLLFRCVARKSHVFAETLIWNMKILHLVVRGVLETAES